MIIFQDNTTRYMMRMNGLHGAAYNADLDGVREFLRLGADPNEYDDQGFVPLLWAALRGAVGDQASVVATLIEAGADPNARTQKGDSTALMWAVESGNLEVIRTLVSGGADINLAADEVTPLMVAAREGNEEVVQLLLELGANPRAKVGHFTAADYADYGGHEGLAKILRPSADGGYLCTNGSECY